VISHWDEVDGVRREKGPMAGTWQPLGGAAGSKTIGVNRIRIDPGRLSTPPHSHNRAEEIFFVLGGSGLSWQDGRVCEVRAGDTIVHLADHEEHTPRVWTAPTCSFAHGIPSSTAGCARAMRFGCMDRGSDRRSAGC
jgi:hypothetical protein